MGWREKALTFLRWARANDGTITLADLKRHGLSRTWATAWLVDTGARDGRCSVYRLTPNAMALPDHGYADVYAELCAILDRQAPTPQAVAKVTAAGRSGGDSGDP